MNLTFIIDPPPDVVIDTMRLGTRFADDYGNIHVWWLGHQLCLKNNGTWNFAMEDRNAQD